MYHVIRSLAITLFFATTAVCTNKVVYFISPPRSLSVAFLRMMEARGDFSIMHEPSQFSFNLANSPGVVQSWYRPEALRSFADVKSAILQASKGHNVFVKEMSFAVHDHHLIDFELMQNPDVYFVFLVRNPHHTTISMYKKLKHVFDEVAYQMPDLVGYKAAYEIFQVAEQHAVNKPYILCTEDLCNNTEATIRAFCEHVGIDFKPDSLHWNDLGSQFDAQEVWHEAKHAQLVNHWHGDAIRSTGFGKLTAYEVDAQGNPTFSEIEQSEHRDVCRNIYLEHLPYYELLLKHAVR